MLSERTEPASSAPPEQSSRAGGVAVVAVALVVAVGVVLRFTAPPYLWLDEAQSVAIARSSLGGLYTGLREDGAPPLYYLLLHGWMAVFGQGAFAVRSLSGLFSVAALPVAWVLGRRLAGPRSATALVVLLASSPFAVRYGSETRMYALVVLLVLLGAAAITWVPRRRGPLPVLAVAVSTAALLYTHYWASYLLAAVTVVTLAAVRWRRDVALRVLAGLVLGGVAFLPWVPTLLWQLRHTGTPWAGVGGMSALTSALSAWRGGGRPAPKVLGWVFVALALLAVCTVRTGGALRLGMTRSPGRWALVATSVGTLVIAGAASLLTSSATVARYTSVAFPAFLALVAVGIAQLPGRRAAALVLAACALVGLSGAVAHVRVPRTQAGAVAAVLGDAEPGDVVAFCPDQLGPAVARVAPPGLDLVVYPDLRPAGRVVWTDYAARNQGADPAAVAAAVSRRAAGHAVWVVTGRGYRVPSDATCSRFRDDLAALRGDPREVLDRDRASGEAVRVHVFRPVAG